VARLFSIRVLFANLHFVEAPGHRAALGAAAVLIGAFANGLVQEDKLPALLATVQG